jgi:hypothetical protein
MSTSRDGTDDRIVNLLSHWLARHVDDDELRRELAARPLDDLDPDQREAVKELRAALDAGDRSRGDLEMLARETLEALALGG